MNMTDNKGEVFTIDIREAIELLERAVDERGHSYVDPGSDPCSTRSCVNVYWDDEEEKWCPSCIAGTVFVYAGVPEEFLSLHNGTAHNSAASINEDDEIPVKVTPEAAVLLRAAQREQDNGKSWGEAVDFARDLASTLRIVGNSL